jgi:hypothetical protein
MTKLISDWHEEGQKKSERQWDESLQVLGIEQVRLLVLNAKPKSYIDIPNPTSLINPETKLTTTFKPTVEYAAQWISREIDKETKNKEKELKTTLRIQKTALRISALGAIATIANVIRLFFQ